MRKPRKSCSDIAIKLDIIARKLLEVETFTREEFEAIFPPPIPKNGGTPMPKSGIIDQTLVKTNITGFLVKWYNSRNPVYFKNPEYFDFSPCAWYNLSLREIRINGEFAMDTNITTGAPSNIKEIKNKMYFRGKVLKTTLAGALVDIGLETPGMVHISQLQKEPVKRVEDVIHEGDEVDVWVRRVSPKKGRIELTMFKPLGLEWGEIKKDMVVTGKVVRSGKIWCVCRYRC